MESSRDAIEIVVKFSREIGDLHTLSDVGIKLLALRYALEAQIHETSHLRSSPSPLHTVNMRELPESEKPGWGSNVPNLVQWEAFEQAGEGGCSNSSSRILPLKDLNFSVIPVYGAARKAEEQENGDRFFCKPGRFLCPKKELKINGKMMVADGNDATHREYRDDIDDWQQAISQSTHGRYLKRKAKCKLSEESKKLSQSNGRYLKRKAKCKLSVESKKLSQTDVESSTLSTILESNDIMSDGGSGSVESSVLRNSGKTHFVNEILNVDELKHTEQCNISAGLEQMVLEDKKFDT